MLKRVTAVSVGVGVEETVGDGVTGGVGDGVGEEVGEGEAVGDDVGDGAGEDVGEGVSEGVGSGGVAVGDGVGEDVGDGVGDGAGDGAGGGIGLLPAGPTGAVRTSSMYMWPVVNGSAGEFSFPTEKAMMGWYPRSMFESDACSNPSTVRARLPESFQPIASDRSMVCQAPGGIVPPTYT